MKLSTYRVYIAQPLKARARKHSVLIYRTAAASAEEARATVRREIIDDEDRVHKGEIVAVTHFGSTTAVVLDGVVFWTPAELEVARKKEESAE